ncbi:hypothetical protein C8Q78DRAFT_1000599 [Trametes maxima]|nr:hypothetical protein C8Q78DRAFT_1000599 [Trametes maxima]
MRKHIHAPPVVHKKHLRLCADKRPRTRTKTPRPGRSSTPCTPAMPPGSTLLSKFSQCAAALIDTPLPTTRIHVYNCSFLLRVARRLCGTPPAQRTRTSRLPRADRCQSGLCNSPTPGTVAPGAAARLSMQISESAAAAAAAAAQGAASSELCTLVTPSRSRSPEGLPRSVRAVIPPMQDVRPSTTQRRSLFLSRADLSSHRPNVTDFVAVHDQIGQVLSGVLGSVLDRA